MPGKFRRDRESGLLLPEHARRRGLCDFNVGPAFMGSAKSGGDPYWSSVVSLLYFNGANGSSTFTDQVSGVTWSLGGGSPQISTSQTIFGGSSGYFNGGSWLYTGPSTAFDFGSNDFTVEYFIYPLSLSGQQEVLGKWNNEQGTAWTSGINGGNPFIWTSTNEGVNFPGSSASVSTGSWWFIACYRFENTLYLATGQPGGNAVPQYMMNMSSVVFKNPVAQTRLGAQGGAGDNSYFNGYIGEIRVTNGVGRYTSSAFPVPSAQFPNY